MMFAPDINDDDLPFPLSPRQDIEAAFRLLSPASPRAPDANVLHVAWKSPRNEAEWEGTRSPPRSSPAQHVGDISGHHSPFGSHWRTKAIRVLPAWEEPMLRSPASGHKPSTSPALQPAVSGSPCGRGDSVLKMFGCDGRCGFKGSFTEVARHETDCLKFWKLQATQQLQEQWTAKATTPTTPQAGRVPTKNTMSRDGVSTDVVFQRVTLTDDASVRSTARTVVLSQGEVLSADLPFPISPRAQMEHALTLLDHATILRHSPRAARAARPPVCEAARSTTIVDDRPSLAMGHVRVGGGAEGVGGLKERGMGLTDAYRPGARQSGYRMSHPIEISTSSPCGLSPGVCMHSCNSLYICDWANISRHRCLPAIAAPYRGLYI